MKITIEEIENAALVLLDDKNSFYDGNLENKTGERINVIKCLENKNIVACPGSGKTTVLLAKLLILANKMPFADGRGLCVFTHTNVAIDKIKEELGAKSDILFNYPNFFGTIQSFVNKYLATPSYISKHGFRPTIDSFKYYEAVKKSYNKGGAISRHVPWIIGQVRHSGIEPHVFLGHMRFKFDDFDVIAKGSIFNGAFETDTTKDHYQNIKRFKEMIYKYGYMPYEEAYTEAYEYLNKNPKIGEAIQKRFKYVFVDEMQDSGAHQVDILFKLFYDKKDVLFQCFGDANQALYNDGRDAGKWEPDSTNSLYISSTKRFSNEICNAINTLRINYHNELPALTSSSKNNSYAPYLLVFDEKNKEKVIEKYSEIIAENNVPNDNGYYCVGRIAKEPKKGQLSIKAYFPNYEKSIKIENNNYDELESYFILNQNLSVKKRFKAIVSSILYLLDANDIKNPTTRRKYTRRTLLEFIRENKETDYFKLRTSILKWFKLLDEGVSITELKKKVIPFYQTLFDSLWNISLSETNSFFSDTIIIPEENETTEVNSIEFKKNNSKGEEVSIPIKINTVNGEKGKTHSSTLYLETFIYSYDIEKVLGYLSGDQIKLKVQGPNKGKIVDSTPLEHMKFTFVGMSRPKHLLCVAVRNIVLTSEIKSKLISNGWIINEDLI